jgi:hypothetical protein
MVRVSFHLFEVLLVGFQQHTVNIVDHSLVLYFNVVLE